MSQLFWEKSQAWRWLVMKTRDSKPFFYTFAAVCGLIPGAIGYGVMTATNTRTQKLESELRKKSRPDTELRLPRFHPQHRLVPHGVVTPDLCAPWLKRDLGDLRLQTA
ncbi:hypothetical protein GIB67_016060 [Kingdonia uniflora]|uniref:Uncharacterized protein n=1 Tax=Kingdonia uniflora TaxID=39325 RepID=A0A7J7L236_9MAGN|nr:hypothetical protein GIB67_016060 [Kingdonia uniflora]